MAHSGRILQVIGLIVTGVGAVAGFWSDVTEGTFMMLWMTGLVTFFGGTYLLRR